MERAYMQTPVGLLCMEAEMDAVTRIAFADEKNHEKTVMTPLLEEAVRQLNAYFAGERRVFSLPVRLKGTTFQIQVWEEIAQIPYGESRTYGEIAKRVGKAGAARAVGMACNKNPLSILYPCHRVVGAKGRLTGYAGGVEKKACLLSMEQKYNGKYNGNTGLYSNCFCIEKGVDIYSG